MRLQLVAVYLNGTFVVPNALVVLTRRFGTASMRVAEILHPFYFLVDTCVDSVYDSNDIFGSFVERWFSIFNFQLIVVVSAFHSRAP